MDLTLPIAPWLLQDGCRRIRGAHAVSAAAMRPSARPVVPGCPLYCASIALATTGKSYAIRLRLSLANVLAISGAVATRHTSEGLRQITSGHYV